MLEEIWLSCSGVPFYRSSPASMIFGIHSWMLRPSRACSELLWNGMLEEMCKIPQILWSGGGVQKIGAPV